MAETILLIYYCSRFIDICNTKNIIILQEENIGQIFFLLCIYQNELKIPKKIQSFLIIFAQRYLCKCKNTYIILQNKYLCIYEDSFGAKILRDNCTLYMFFFLLGLMFLWMLLVFLGRRFFYIHVFIIHLAFLQEGTLTWHNTHITTTYYRYK